MLKIEIERIATGEKSRFKEIVLTAKGYYKTTSSIKNSYRSECGRSKTRHINKFTQ